MANTPVISPESWEALKAASIRGVPDSQLAESFGVEEGTIRIKRFRDEVWKAALAVKVTVKGDNKGDETQIVTKGPETAEIAQKVASTVSENIASIATANNLLALQIAQKGLQKASLAPPEVKSWSDVEILTKITQKAAGLEGSQAVQVNILNDSPCAVEQGDFPVFDCED